MLFNNWQTAPSSFSVPKAALYELVFVDVKPMRALVDDIRTAFEVENDTAIYIPTLS